MNFTYKLAAFDLDDTLSKSKQSLGEEVAILLGKLAEKTPVAVISGGSFIQFEKQFLSNWKKFVPQSAQVNRNVILLPTCGTQTYMYDIDSSSWVKKEEHSFSELTREKIIRALTSIIASGEMDIPKEHYGNHIEDRGTQITFSGLGQDAPSDKKSLWDPTFVKRQKIKAKLEAEVPEIEASIGGTTSLDILPKNFDKAVALDLLIQRLAIEKTEVIFVGDALFPGGNDYPVHRAGYTTERVYSPEDTVGLLKKWLS